MSEDLRYHGPHRTHPPGRTMHSPTWLLTLCAMLLGCSSGGAPRPADDRDGALVTDGGAGDARTDDLQADLAQAGPLTLVRHGLVEARAISNGIVPDRHGSTATARLYDLAARGERCVRTLIAGCLLTQCESTTAPPNQSAGPIRIEGGLIPVTLTFSGSLYLDYSNGNANNWPVGVPLTISAPGADSPAFSATVTMPERVLVKTPEHVQAGVNFIVRRTADLPLTWEGGGRGALWLVASVGKQTLECGFPASNGRGTVLADALGAMAGGSGTLWIFTADTREVSAGAALTRVRAAYSAVGHDGREFTAQLSLF